MNIFKKFLLGALLLSSRGAQNVYAMESYSECPQILRATESVEEILRNLKIQLALSVFIVMRVDLAYFEENYWDDEPVDNCCLPFTIPTEENRLKHVVSKKLHPNKNPYSLNEGMTDLVFTSRLLGHLDILHEPQLIESIQLDGQLRRVVLQMTYEMFCTLSSLASPTKFSDTQIDFINRLFATYLLKEKPNDFEISMQDIEQLIAMSKTLLLKLLDLKFLRSYPCNYKNEKERQFGKGYLKREAFCTHYIDVHCSYLERYPLYCILNWFRLESQALSSEQVYDFVLDYFKQESQDSSSDQDSSTDEEYNFLSSYRITRY